MFNLPTREELLAEKRRREGFKAKNHLLDFMTYTFEKRNGYPFILNDHHVIICDELMDVFRGKTKRLIINMPPRYTKTEAAVVNFVPFCFGHYPDSAFIHVSYAAALAEMNSGNTQSVMLHESYNDVFPGVQLDMTPRGKWTTTKNGVFYATGAAGSLTGFGAGRMRKGFGGAIIIDDPHKPDEATSDTVRPAVIEWYKNTLKSRTNHPDTPIIVIMQRLHEEDLAGWLLSGGTGEEWRHVCLPALTTDSEGNEVALWPWKHDLATLKEMERTAPYEFAGQYMQTPGPLGGGIFKTAWWKYYDWHNPPKFTRIIQSWDTAFKTKETNDYSCCATWGEFELGYALIDVWKGKLEYPELKRKEAELFDKYHPHASLVEDTAAGQSLIQDMKRIPSRNVLAIKADKDKVARANAVTPIIEAGKAWLPKGHPEIPGFVQSHATFPNAAHDDDVDTTTQALAYMSRGQQMQRVRLAGI